MGACVKELYRGIWVCEHSITKYERLAKISGPNFYLKPINGILSKLATSADTHALYGACDFEGDTETVTEVKTVSNQARSCLLMAYPRIWKDNVHIHTGDPECPNMSSALKAQFVLFGRGLNALADNGPDPGSSQYRAQIMALYNKYGKPGVAPKTYSFAAVAAPAPAPVPTKKPTAVSIKAFPAATVKHFPMRLDLVLTPAAPGIFQLQFAGADGVWKDSTMKRPVPVNGKLTMPNLTPGFAVKYRVQFKSSVATHASSTSPEVVVPVIDVVALEKRVTALESK